MNTKVRRTNYTELVRAVGTRERVAMIDVRRILDAAISIINDRVAEGEAVIVGDLGTFRGTGVEEARRMSFRRSKPKRKAEGHDATSD